MTVLRVDLRRGRNDAGYDTVSDTVSVIVREAVDRAQGCEAPRFLIVDRTADMVGHQPLYEELLAYGPVPTVCLAVGVPSSDGEASDPSVLARPLSLRPPSAGVLWVPDPEFGTAAHGGESAEAGEERRWQAARPLAALLEEPAVFDAVLHALREVSDGVAVPAPHLLEHDLTEGARTRAWRQALEGLVGTDAPAAPSSLSSTGEDSVPAELAPLIGEEVPKALGDRAWCRPGGEIDERRRACETALHEAQAVYEYVRSPAALLRGTAAPTGLPERLEELARTLGAYRDTAAEVLRDGDGVRLQPDQRVLLDRRGIDLPDIPEASRERVGPGLRRWTETLIGRRLPLRSAAARLAALSDRSAPAGSASRLARLDEVCPPGYLGELASPAPFTVGAPRPWADAVPAFGVALLAGLWSGPGWVTGPLAGLAAVGLTLLMLSHRPTSSADRRLDGGGSARTALRLAAGLAGGLTGAVAGSVLGLPPWAGLAALSLAVIALVSVSMWLWTAAVDEWWAGMRPEFAAEAATGIERLLSEAAVHDWLLGEARLNCADGARAVSVLLRNLAAEVEAYDQEPGAAPSAASTPAPAPMPVGEAEPEPDGAWEPWDWDSWTVPAAQQPADPAPEFEDPDKSPSLVPEQLARSVEPPWLERETGDGGWALVETLVGDLADGVLQIVADCWGALERDPAAVARLRVRPRVTELLDEESECLARDGAAAPPQYVRAPERRPGTAELLGLTTDRVARVLAPGEEAVPPRPLCSAGRKRMLSRDPGGTRSVRFAPEAARRGATHDPLGESSWNAAGEDVVWTLTGRFTGVLRLVPLRGGSVRTVRSYGEQGAEDGPGRRDLRGWSV